MDSHTGGERRHASTAEPPVDLPPDPAASYNPEQTALGIRGLPKGTWPPAGVPTVPTAGEFEFHEIIGQGGFGEVWAALQVKLGRIVAVKRLRNDLIESVRGTDQEEELGRAFRQEAITTACLDHPNIVPIHELDVDAEGTPILAMKRVQGRPWHQVMLADSVDMSLDDYLARHIPILVSVAQAAAFAHSRGVVHRDIKPAQVMIGDFGEVLLTDWGLAVLHNPTALAHLPQSAAFRETPTTDQATNPAGTVSYMAPEQTESTAFNIGPWTDVYLLGGCLYFLLTLQAPHASDDACEAFIRARQGLFRPPEEVNPGRHLPPELTELCRRAMMANPADRIQDASVFVEELLDFQSGSNKRSRSGQLTLNVIQRLQSISGPAYREYGDLMGKLAEALALWPGNEQATNTLHEITGRFAAAALDHRDLLLARVQAERLEPGREKAELLQRIEEAERTQQRHARQRSLMLSVAIVLLAVIGAVSLFFSARVSSERNDALEARWAALEERDWSDDLVQYMLENFRDSLKELDRLDLMDEAALRALKHYQAVEVNGMSGADLARANKGLLQVGLIFMEQGDTSNALTSFQRAEEMARHALKRMPLEKEWLYRLAVILSEKGQVQDDRGELTAARRSYEESLEIFRRNIDTLESRPIEYVEFIHVLYELGTLNLAEGKSGEARACFEEGITRASQENAKQPDRSDWIEELLLLHSGMGRFHEGEGDLKAAVKAYRESGDLIDRQLARMPEDGIMLRQRAINYSELADVHLMAGETDEAIGLFDKAGAIRQAMVNRDPANPGDRMALASSMLSMGDALETAGQQEEALGKYRAAIAELEPLVVRDPSNADWQHLLGVCHTYAGKVYFARKDYEQAAREYEAFRDIMARLVEGKSPSGDMLREYSTAHNLMGRVHEVSERPEQALEEYTQALELREQLVQGSPANPRWRHDLSVSHSNVGRVLERLDRSEEALVHEEASVALDRGLAEDQPEEVILRRDLALGLANLGAGYMYANRAAEGVEPLREAVEIMNALVDGAPPGLEVPANLLTVRQQLGEAHLRTESKAEAREQANRMIQEALALAESEKDAAAKKNLQTFLARGKVLLARVEVAEGSREEAETLYLESVKLFQESGGTAELDRRSRMDMALALISLGRKVEAQAVLKDVRFTEADHPALWGLARQHGLLPDAASQPAPETAAGK